MYTEQQVRLLVGDDYDTEYFKEDPLIAVRGRIEVCIGGRYEQYVMTTGVLKK